MMRAELLKIVYWSAETAPEGERKPAARDRIEAAKNVVMMDLALLAAEAAAGMYKKPISEIAREFQYEPLPPEVRMVIIAAWKRGGMLPAAAIEEMVPSLSQVMAELPPQSAGTLIAGLEQQKPDCGRPNPAAFNESSRGIECLSIESSIAEHSRRQRRIRCLAARIFHRRLCTCLKWCATNIDGIVNMQDLTCAIFRLALPGFISG